MAKFKKNLKILGGGIIAFFGMLTGNLFLRSVYLRILRFFGRILLRLFPGIYNRVDAENAKFASDKRIKDKYAPKEQIIKYMKKAEKKQIPFQEVRKEVLKMQNDQQAVLPELADLFNHYSREEEVLIQYSGGSDSSLIALLAARYFKRVHLITIVHTYITGFNKACYNAVKLIEIAGQDKMVHSLINTTAIVRKVLFDTYWRDLKKYGTFVCGIGCLGCKLSCDTATIKYALDNKISLALDGSDLSVKIQLNQGCDEILNARYANYKKYDIEFLHPAVKFQDNAFVLARMGLELNNPVLLYSQQPGCIGNDFFNEVYDRFYFLPKYGYDKFVEQGVSWFQEKLPLCEEFLENDEVLKPRCERQFRSPVKHGVYAF